MAENGLYDVLRMGISSLRAQSRAIETVGRNMANVNNPTYARQRVIFGDVSPTGGASVGVSATGMAKDTQGILMTATAAGPTS
jgi:flagellar hook-associated protein 1 FlgK